MTSDEAAMLTAAYDSSIRQVGTQRWLQELIGQRQRRQHFGTLETIGELLAVGVGSGRARAEVAEHQLSSTAVQALLAAARSSTLSRPRAGCTHGACMFGALIRA